MSTDLNKMFPLPVHVTVRCDDTEQEVVVRQLKVGQISQAMKIVSKLSFLFDSYVKGDFKFDPRLIFVEHTDDCLDLVAICAGVERSFLNKLDLDSGIDLFVAVLEVNLDFFLRSVLPSVLRAMAKVRAALPEKKSLTSGETPSNASSEPVTATATS